MTLIEKFKKFQTELLKIMFMSQWMYEESWVRCSHPAWPTCSQSVTSSRGVLSDAVDVWDICKGCASLLVLCRNTECTMRQDSSIDLFFRRLWFVFFLFHLSIKWFGQVSEKTLIRFIIITLWVPIWKCGGSEDPPLKEKRRRNWTHARCLSCGITWTASICHHQLMPPIYKAS